MAIDVAVEVLAPHGLSQDRVEGVEHADPDAEAQGEHNDPGAQLSAAVTARVPAVRSRRFHDATFLSLLAVVQLVWLAVLGYQLFSLFT